jgi:myo-inositol-1(or 4)-monophosphatase
LAEEGTVSTEERPWQWIIDPLDGTTNFLHGLPFFSISLALQYEGETVIGIVYEANRQELFYSWKGASAAFLNGKPIHVSPTTQLEDSLLATGFPYYDFERMPAYIEVLQRFMRDTRGLRRFGSAALDLAYVACGRFDGYFEYSLSPWDVAAGAFLVQQAGGQVSDFSGGRDFIHGQEIVAVNDGLFQTILAGIQKHFK